MRGVSLAIALAAPLWIAAQVGATSDRLTGLGWPAESGPLRRVVACVAALVWLESGALARAVALTTARANVDVHGVVVGAVATIARALGLGVALAIGPLVVALTVELGVGAIARAGSPNVAGAFAIVVRPLAAIASLGVALEVAVHAAMFASER